MASLLLSHGADVNAKTNGGTTAIQLAVSEKQYNAVVEGNIFRDIRKQKISYEA